MTLPAASLVLCTRDRPAFLVDTLRSILAGDEVPAEIVVADQSAIPREGLAALAEGRPCEIRHVPLRSVGLGRARNAGVAAARHEILAFIDDDMWVGRGWWGALLRSLLAEGPRSVVTGQVRAAPPEVPGGIAPSVMLGDERRVYEGRLDGDVLAAGNMALHRAAFAEVGMFDERLGAGGRFPSSEDNDFCFRLLEAGYRIVYEPDAVLEHRAWRTKGDYVRLRWRYGRGNGAYYAKHLAPGDGRMLRRMGADVARQLGKVPGRLRRRELRMMASDAAFVLGLAAGAAEWLLTQRRDG
ncbi:MAG TPA: glycosyltransferase [Thermoanaerobaculia bacterium]